MRPERSMCMLQERVHKETQCHAEQILDIMCSGLSYTHMPPGRLCCDFGVTSGLMKLHWLFPGLFFAVHWLC
ncbi:hypothetical protein XELAEV_18039042mg [Xenopus laevis]|uniref:Uncharacterized protein n=1 Tax=Xenopus laevis TaxID=8355 RepID=A0A974C6Q4_XENLA|nr:hypothetical protein XELAEV_18039042mg [Xenopus laevis]